MTLTFRQRQRLKRFRARCTWRSFFRTLRRWIP